MDIEGLDVSWEASDIINLNRLDNLIKFRFLAGAIRCSLGTIYLTNWSRYWAYEDLWRQKCSLNEISYLENFHLLQCRQSEV